MTRDDTFTKILKSIPKNKNVRLHLAPRFGKTKLIIELIKRDNPLSILWATPSKKLADEDIPSEFEKWGGSEYLNRLEMTTWSSLKKCEGPYDLIVLDEEQFATEKNCVQFLNRKLKGRKISMTGTPSNRSDKEAILYDIGMRKIAYTLSIEEAISMNIISDFEIIILAIGLSDEPYSAEYGSRSEKNVYDMLDKKAKQSYNSGGSIPYEVIARANFIKKSSTKVRLAKLVLQQLCKGRTLIFAPSIDYAEELCEHTYHSKSASKDSLDKFQNKEINKLAMVRSGSVGYTYEGVEFVLIMQMDSNKTGLSTQKLARSLLKEGDKKVKVFIIALDKTQDMNWISDSLRGFSKKRLSLERVSNLVL